MADIIQAARWMQEGKRVKRAEWEAEYGVANKAFLIRWLNGNRETHAPFSVQDLLATDWELAPDPLAREARDGE
jgi:hypothetical protein